MLYLARHASGVKASPSSTWALLPLAHRAAQPLDNLKTGLWPLAHGDGFSWGSNASSMLYPYPTLNLAVALTHTLTHCTTCSSLIPARRAAGEPLSEAKTPRLTVISEAILKSNPITEAFGNAKTSRNANSSRFGKFIKLQFGSCGAVAGAQIRTYLLERPRVSEVALGERSYHIFYQVPLWLGLVASPVSAHPHVFYQVPFSIRCPSPCQPRQPPYTPRCTLLLTYTRCLRGRTARSGRRCSSAACSLKTSHCCSSRSASLQS